MLNLSNILNAVKLSNKLNITQVTDKLSIIETAMGLIQSISGSNQSQPSIEMPMIRPVPIKTNGLTRIASVRAWWASLRKWEVTEDWHFTLASNGLKIVVPKGYVFNGASIPRILRSVISPTGIFFIPSLIHDFAYDYNFVWVATGDLKEPFRKHHLTTITDEERQEWDKLFNEVGNQVNGMPILGKLLHIGLMVGGSFAWKSSREVSLELIKPAAPENRPN